MATCRDYRFALADWQPEGVEVISTGWGHASQNGLPYIRISAVVRVGEQVIIPECQCDPCDEDEEAKAGYAERVHQDMELAIEKALKAVAPPGTVDAIPGGT